MAALRLILIPGMGADERLFRPQAAGGLRFEVPPFPIPRRNETMASYAARMAAEIQPHGPCVIGGVSFGGMVACEMARFCHPRAVVLIASCRSGAAVPSWNKPFELVSRLLPEWIIQRRAVASSRMIARMEALTRQQYHLIREMSVGVPVPFLRGAAKMILSWKGHAVPCPVYHIHGEKDRIIPISRVSPDEVVPDGGHLINLTHAAQVNAFLARHLAKAAEAPSQSVASESRST